jgi:hypothetical protein
VSEQVDGARGVRVACRVLLYASAQFVVLTVAAMLVYPGGNAQDPTAVGYSFFENFFSDLGQTWVRYGNAHTANPVASPLFVVALVTVGLAVAWAAWPIGRCLGAGGRVGPLVIGLAGLIAGAGFIGVALNPWNLRLGLHMTFVKTAFLGLLVFMLAVAVEAARHHWPRWFVVVGWVYSAALAAYFVDLLYGPSIATRSGAQIQAVSQKAIVYLSIVCLSVIAWEVRRRSGQSTSARISSAARVSLSDPER